MTVHDIMETVDRLSPNQITAEDKLRWLNTVEEQIWREIVCTHEGAPETEYTALQERENGEREKLTVPDAYASLYRFYMEAQIAQANAEMDRYNALADAYNAAYSTYQDWYNRAHMPVAMARKLRFI